MSSGKRTIVFLENSKFENDDSSSELDLTTVTNLYLVKKFLEKEYPDKFEMFVVNSETEAKEILLKSNGQKILIMKDMFDTNISFRELDQTQSKKLKAVAIKLSSWAAKNKTESIVLTVGTDFNYLKKLFLNSKIVFENYLEINTFYKKLYEILDFSENEKKFPSSKNFLLNMGKTTELKIADLQKEINLLKEEGKSLATMTYKENAREEKERQERIAQNSDVIRELECLFDLGNPAKKYDFLKNYYPKF